MPYYTTLNCGAYIQKLVIFQYSSTASLEAAAAAHRVDITVGLDANYSLPPDDIPVLVEHASAYKIWIVPSSFFEHLELNVDPTYVGQPNPLHDTRVRLALALGFDKAGLLRHSLDLSQEQIRTLTAWTPWVNTPGQRSSGADRSITGQWDPVARQYADETGQGRALADARALLAQTPWKHGLTLDLYTTQNNLTRAAEATYLAKSWAKLGVKVNLNFADGGKLFGDWDHGGILAHGAFQVGLFANPLDGDGGDFNTLLQSKYIDRELSVHLPQNVGNGNVSGIHDVIFDRDFDQLGHTFGRTARDKLLAAIQQELNRKAYWIPLFFHPNINTSDSRVLNFSPGSETPFYDVQDWKVRGP
jgi:ABC-type transport system substrate-binding protein